MSTQPAYGENIIGLIARALGNRDVQKGAVRGAAEGPGNTLSALEVIANALSQGYAGERTPMMPDEVTAPTLESVAPTYGPRLANYLGDQTGIPRYTEGPGAVAQMATGSVLPGAVFGGGSGLAALASGAGAGTGEMLRQRGVGDLGQMAGDFVADAGLSTLFSGPAALAAAPLAITRSVGKKAAKAALDPADWPAGARKSTGARKHSRPIRRSVFEAQQAIDFSPVDPAEFVAAREGAREKLEKSISKKTKKPNTGRGEFLSKTTAEDMVKFGTRTFLSRDKRVGFALDAKGDVQGVFSVGPKDAGKAAVIAALREGGKTLDAFEGHLTNDLYPQFGFDEYARDPWNEMFAPEKWNRETYGTPDVVFMERKPNAEPMDLRGTPKKFDPVEMRTRYPRVAFPEVGVNEETGKLFFARGKSPEAEAVMALRKQVQKDIKAGKYEPFFKLEERYDVDPANYPRPEMTTKTLPKLDATQERYRKAVDTPQARDRLKAAYEKGLSELSKNWYMVGQLEDMYVKRLGPEEGRRRFADHIDAIAATTGGNDPTSNWIMARYGIYKRAKGERMPEMGALMPSPVGGRYAGNNAGTFEKLMHGLGIAPDVNPKRYDFARNFLGHVDSGTIDEQMTKLITPEVDIEKPLTKKQIAQGMTEPQYSKKKNPLAPPGDSYGVYQAIIIDTAKEMGIDPRMLQEVAWAGAKSSEGMPMMQHINESIERTSKITGLTPEEVVNGWIDEKLPAFGFAGGVGIAGTSMGRKDQKEKK